MSVSADNAAGEDMSGSPSELCWSRKLNSRSPSYHRQERSRINCFLFWSIALLACVGSPAFVRAANFVTKANEMTNTWVDAIWSNPPSATATSPAAGNTYRCSSNGAAFGVNTLNTRLRNPVSVRVQTFPGDSLTLDANTEIRAKETPGITNNTTFVFPGVDGNPGLVLNGGVLNAGDDYVFEFNGNIMVASPSLICLGNVGAGSIVPGRGIKFSATLTGTGSLIVVQAPINVPSMEVISPSNSFSGDWIVKAGYLKGSTFGALGSGNITIDPGYSVPASLVSAPLSAGPAQFEAMYDLATHGTLTLQNGAKMILHQDCIFSAVTISGIVLSTGRHDYAELAANFPDTFYPGGFGSLSVGPLTPSAPSALDASGGNASVTLVWNGSARATGYIIKRSLQSGGPYSTVHTNDTSTTYLDNGLINSTPYFFVVSAINGDGESANSNEASATPSGTPPPVPVGVVVQGQGTVSRSPEKQLYSIGEQITLSAVAARWFEFSHWGDDLMSNPRIITVGVTNNYAAIFSPTTAVETLTFSNITRVAPVGMPVVFVDGTLLLLGPLRASPPQK